VAPSGRQSKSGFLAHLSAALSVRRAIGTINEWNAALKGSRQPSLVLLSDDRETHWRSPTPTQNNPVPSTQYPDPSTISLKRNPFSLSPKPNIHPMMCGCLLRWPDRIVSYRIVSYRIVLYGSSSSARTLLSDFQFS